jgi:hemoglobin/transferrin/lactoferrin receptor protein
MHKILLSGIFCVLATVCLGQSITVVAEDSKEPIEGAIVISENQVIYIITDSEGVARHKSFQNGKQVSIRALGFETKTMTIDFGKDKDVTVLLSPALFNLDQVVITASRWSQQTDDIPMKILSVDQKLMQFQNPQTAADLLGISGNVFIQKSQQGGGSPMIRGFAANRLIYTVDGVRMNTAIFRGGNIQNVINLDPFSIQRTEVLFGPGSVIYGSDAIGGVMSFQTLAPSFNSSEKWKPTVNLSSRFSSANLEKTGHLDVSLANDSWGFISSLTYWDFDELKQGSKGPTDFLQTQYVAPGSIGNDVIITQGNPLVQRPSGYSQTNFMQKASYRFNEKLSIKYGLHYSETSRYGRYDRLNRLRDGLPQFAIWDYGPQRWVMHLLHVEHSRPNKLYHNASVRVARQDFAESRISRPLYSVFQTTREERVTAYSFNADFLKKWGTSQSLNYGLEYVYNDVNSTGLTTDLSNGNQEDSPSRYPSASWQTLGLYASGNRELSTKWSLNSGLRISAFAVDARFNSDYYLLPFSTYTLSDASVTGSLGVVFRASDLWIFNINAGTAFRAPNVDDIGKVFDSEPGAVTVPNNQLRSEYAYNVDIGSTVILMENLKLDFTGFYTLLDQAMVRRDFSLAGQDSIIYDGQLSKVQAIQNLSEATIYGAQIGVELKTKSGWAVQSDLNLQKGIEKDDVGVETPIRHVAPMFGVTRIQYRKQQWQVELNAQYQGALEANELSLDERSKTEIYAIDDQGRTYAPSWYTLNFKTSYDLKKWLTLNAGVENITDQRYRTYSSGIAAPGRNYVISVRMSY